MITVKLPNGQTVDVDTTDQQAAAAAGQKYWAGMAGNNSQPKPHQDGLQGFMANFNRGTGLGDEMVAGLNAAVDLVRGKAPMHLESAGYDLKNAFDQRMKSERQTEDNFASAHPNVAALARGAGMAPTALIPAGPEASALVNSGRAVNAARGAVAAGLQAAAYSAMDRGTLAQRVKAASDASHNPLVLALGGTAGAFAPAAARAPRAPRTDADALAQAGVSLTPGQRVAGSGPLGDLAKNAEDLAQRAPILGPAISAARSRGNESLNRVVGLTALHPIGEGIPVNIRPGYDTVRYVDARLGNAYDRAAGMVDHVSIDQPLYDDIARIQQQSATLPDSLSPTFGRIVMDRLHRLDQGIDGAGLKAIHSELETLQKHYSSAGGPEGIIGDQIGELRHSLMDLLGRQNPDAADLIGRADRGWAVYSMMNDAAANASKRGGVFTPGQLAIQAKAGAKRIGPNVAGRGEGRLQDLASAAQRVMPDEFGNPGTANALGLGGLVVGAPTAPAQTAATVAGLTAAATPYMLMGRRVLTALPANATAQQIGQASRTLAGLAVRDPAVAALQRELAMRAARGAGVSATPPNRQSLAQPASTQ